MAVNDQTLSTLLHVPSSFTEAKFQKTKNTLLNEPIEVRIHLNYPIKDRCNFLPSASKHLNRYCIYAVKTSDIYPPGSWQRAFCTYILNVV